MSETKTSKPVTVLRHTVKAMSAFGYVDQAFIVAAFETFLKEQPQPEEDKRRGKGVLHWLTKPFSGIGRGGEIAPHERKTPKGVSPASGGMFGPKIDSSIGLLKGLLAHVPQAASVTSRRPGKPKPAHLETLIARHEARDHKLVAKFFRQSGLAETGFPVRLVGPQKSDAADGPLKKGEISRAAALSALTGGLLYRFAYDHEDQLKWDDAGKVFRSKGVYRLFVCPPGQSFVEQRLVLIHLDDDRTVIRAAEIRKRKNGYV
ncbi:MAG: hypothetical protein ACOC05_06420, partial [Oceanicaulis sp.]